MKKSKKKKFEKTSLFKSKKQKIVYLILFIIMIVLFIYLGTVNFSDNLTDAQMFSEEFPAVDEDNVFVYATATEVIDSLSGYSIVLFGSSKNDFTEDYANIINEVAKEGITYTDDEGNEYVYEISQIYYYDFFSDRENNNGNYELLVEELKPYLLTDDTGNIELYAPTLLVIKDGFVLYIDEDLNFISGDVSSEDYWTNLQTGTFKETLKAVFTDFLGLND